MMRPWASKLLKIRDKNKRNETALAGVGGGNVNGCIGDEVGGSIKNPSTVVNLAKKLKSTKLKKTGLSDIKANSETDFLTSRAKKAFIYLQKAFTKVLIFRNFDL